MFYSVVDAEWAISAKFNLVGVVCYYGQHYSTFFFHSKMKIWILFDDSKVKKVVKFAISVLVETLQCMVLRCKV
jgi:ubiquitin C-terminal hydrolase